MKPKLVSFNVTAMGRFYKIDYPLASQGGIEIAELLDFIQRIVKSNGPSKKLCGEC